MFIKLQSKTWKQLENPRIMIWLDLIWSKHRHFLIWLDLIWSKYRHFLIWLDLIWSKYRHFHIWLDLIWSKHRHFLIWLDLIWSKHRHWTFLNLIGFNLVQYMDIGRFLIIFLEKLKTLFQVISQLKIGRFHLLQKPLNLRLRKTNGVFLEYFVQLQFSVKVTRGFMYQRKGWNFKDIHFNIYQIMGNRVPL